MSCVFGQRAPFPVTAQTVLSPQALAEKLIYILAGIFWLCRCPGKGQPHGGQALGLLPRSHRAPPLPLCDTIGWALPAGGAVAIKGLQAQHSHPEGLRRWRLGCRRGSGHRLLRGHGCTGTAGGQAVCVDLWLSPALFSGNVCFKFSARSKLNSLHALLAVLLPHQPCGGAEEGLAPPSHLRQAAEVGLSLGSPTSASVCRDLTEELLGCIEIK